MKAELKKQNNRFEIIVNGEVIISVLHKNNLFKNFRSNKKIKELGVVELFDGDKLICSVTEKIKRTRKTKQPEQPEQIKNKLPQFEGKYKNILIDLLNKKEFKHSELLNRTGLNRPNAELQKELNKLEGFVSKTNLGIGKGVVYKVL